MHALAESIRESFLEVVTGDCELGCWKLNLDPLKEQYMLLNSDPSLQVPVSLFYTSPTLFTLFLLVCCHPCREHM